jgi:hypothetical protein
MAVEGQLYFLIKTHLSTLSTERRGRVSRKVPGSNLDLQINHSERAISNTTIAGYGIKIKSE